MTNPVSILIADDHLIVRDGLKMLLDVEADITVIAETDNGKDAVILAQELSPDIAILDISMPQLNGIDAAREIRQTTADTKVILLSMYSDEEYVLEAIHAGISGYVVKQSAAETLISAVKAVWAGQAFFSPEVSQTILNAAMNTSRSSSAHQLNVNLTPREKEVLKLIVKGNTSRQIANILFVSLGTADKHRQNIMRKLNVHDLASLTRFAIERKLV